MQTSTAALPASNGALVNSSILPLKAANKTLRQISTIQMTFMQISLKKA
jgi:hypothetical protein